MKKQKDTLVITLCVLFTVFLTGVFIGRATSDYPVSLKRADEDIWTAETTESADLFIGKKMNINVATVRELQLIPNIGETVAENIVEYRREHGPFQSLSDLCNVDGLGSDRILQLIDYITIGGPYEDIGR